MSGEMHRLTVEVPVAALPALVVAAGAAGKLTADYAREAVLGWRDLSRFAEAVVEESKERREALEAFAEEFVKAARPEAIGEGAEKMVAAWNRLCERAEMRTKKI